MKLNLSPQDLKLGNYLAEFPMIHSAPIYFGNPNEAGLKINNGTGSLLKRDRRLFVATNHHVVDEYRERCRSEAGISLEVGGLTVDALEERVCFEDDAADVVVIDFSDRQVTDFGMFGDVPTQFHEIGEIDPGEQQKGKVVAFGGYPGAFRVQVSTNEVNFHTFSSGASIVEEVTERMIVVNIDHSESKITSLSPKAPPAKLGGLSGGPVFLISSVRGLTTFRFAGIISECSNDFNVMFAKPVHLFSRAFG